MPRVVDHEVRRDEIVNALLEIASSRGLHAVTSRSIGQQLGVATSALWHYFPNFNAVLGAAFAEVFARTDRRIVEQTVGLSGTAAVEAMMREILPSTKLTMDEAHVVVGYWGRVAIDEKLAAHQLDLESAWRERLRNHLEEALAAGELTDDAPIGDIVDLLMSVAFGQQVEAVLKPHLDAVAAKSRVLAAACLAPWRMPAPASVTGSVPA